MTQAIHELSRTIERPKQSPVLEFKQLSQKQLENAAELLLEHSDYLTDETLNTVALEILRRDSNVRATLNPTEIRKWRDGNPEQAAIADIILEVAAGARNLILMPYTKELGETINNGIKDNKSLWKRLFSKSKTEIIQEAYNLLAKNQLIKERLAQSEAEIKTNNAAASLILAETREEANQIIEEAELRASQKIKEAEEQVTEKISQSNFELKCAQEKLAEIKEIQKQLLESNGDIQKVFEQTIQNKKEDELKEYTEVLNEYLRGLQKLPKEEHVSHIRVFGFFEKLIAFAQEIESQFGLQVRLDLFRLFEQKAIPILEIRENTSLSTIKSRYTSYFEKELYYKILFFLRSSHFDLERLKSEWNQFCKLYLEAAKAENLSASSEAQLRFNLLA